jgi:hypothetical protein
MTTPTMIPTAHWWRSFNRNHWPGIRMAGMWVSLVLLLGILVLPFLPETKDKPLPE